jgi:hypothetical protein
MYYGGDYEALSWIVIGQDGVNVTVTRGELEYDPSMSYRTQCGCYLYAVFSSGSIPRVGMYSDLEDNGREVVVVILKVLSLRLNARLCHETGYSM